MPITCSQCHAEIKAGEEHEHQTRVLCEQCWKDARAARTRKTHWQYLKSTVDAYGGVDLLLNNAGVAAGASLWESTSNDCQWVIGVNLWGVIHCIREFVPIMLGQNTRGHIVNTSSIAGLTTYHPSALYHLTKHGIVALSEQLHHDLAIKGQNIKVSVLCPGFVHTRIMDAECNRPETYQNHLSVIEKNLRLEELDQIFRQMVEAGMPPLTVAKHVFEAIVDEKFFIFTHPELKPLIQKRLEDIIEERNPVLPPIEQPYLRCFLINL